MSASAEVRNKRHYVRVDGWSNSRTIIESGDKIQMEIALEHNHCSTCSDRVRHVTRKLAERNVQYSWAYPEGSKSFIAVDHPGDGVCVKKHLSDLLGLSIS